MPNPNDPQGPREPDHELRRRAGRFLPGSGDPDFLGGRKPFDIYYGADGRPITRDMRRFFIPSPTDGETRLEACERVGRRSFGNVMKLSMALAADGARFLQILQTSTINDLARISPLGGSMTHAMNQVIAETQYGLFAPRDRKGNNSSFSNIAQIGEIIALSGALGRGGGNIAPHGML